MDGVCGLTVGDGPVAHQAHEETEDTSFSNHENGNKEKQQINKCIHSVISDYLSNSVNCFQTATNCRFQTDPKSHRQAMLSDRISSIFRGLGGTDGGGNLVALDLMKSNEICEVI